MERKFVEFVEYSIGNRGVFIDTNQYANIKRDYEAYTSLFTFTEEVIDYVKNNISKKTQKPSIEGYIGKCSSSYLWIDVDVEGNLPLATKSMIEIVYRLNENYGITYKSLKVFFSGSKGYHIGIPSKCFGAQEYSSEILPSVHKSMVKAICGNISGVDYVVYNTSRIWRCPFSKNQKSGRYKIPVDVKKLELEGIDDMLICADFGASHCTYSLNIEFSERLKLLFDNCVSRSTSTADVFIDNDGYDSSLSVLENRSIFRMPEKGQRNDLVYKMAYRLFSITGLKVNEVSDIMKFIYDVVNEYSLKRGIDRYSEMEFKTSLNSAYSRTRLKKPQAAQAKTFNELAEMMYKKIQLAKYATTIIPEITEDLKGGWTLGNSYALIGLGGTMKSFYMQEELIKAALDDKKDSLIINLEMSDVTLFDRIWMALFEKSMSDMIKDGGLTYENFQEMKELAETMLSNYLHIFNGVDIEPDDLESIIKSKEDEIKRKISIVGVDSVSGMKLYNDSESMTALKISKGNKEAAKNTNTAILTINHANSSAKKTNRDPSEFVRGGQKFVDNCDAYIGFSYVVDKDKSVIDAPIQDIIYRNDLRYLRFVNKRGSGNTINKIIQFTGGGRVKVLDEPVSNYEVPITQNKLSYY